LPLIKTERSVYFTPRKGWRQEIIEGKPFVITHSRLACSHPKPHPPRAKPVQRVTAGRLKSPKLIDKYQSLVIASQAKFLSGNKPIALRIFPGKTWTKLRSDSGQFWLNRLSKTAGVA
jgi:hypothetical protein